MKPVAGVVFSFLYKYSSETGALTACQSSCFTEERRNAHKRPVVRPGEASPGD